MSQLSLILGFGPSGWADTRLFGTNFQTGLTGVTFPATDGGANAPPAASRWWKMDSTASQLGFAQATLNSPAVAGRDYMWLCYQWSMEGPLTASAVEKVEDGFSLLYWVEQTSSTFKLRLGATELSSSTFDVNDPLSIRLQRDGTTDILWVNGSQEAARANADSFGKSLFLEAPSNADAFYFSSVALTTGTAADRPAALIPVQLLDPSGNQTAPSGEDEYGDESTCISADGTFTKWQLDGNDVVDTSTFNCGEPATTEQQMSEMSAYTKTPDYEPFGIIARYGAAAQTAAKVVNTNARLRDPGDPGNVDEVAMMNLTSLTHLGRVVIWDTDAAGADWDEAAIDDMRLGVGHTDANGREAKFSGMMAEVFEWKADPIVTGARRRPGPQVI